MRTDVAMRKPYERNGSPPRSRKHCALAPAVRKNVGRSTASRPGATAAEIKPGWQSAGSHVDAHGTR
jgi:hypothetical protein